MDQRSFAARLEVTAFYSSRLVAFFLACGHSGADDFDGRQYVHSTMDDPECRRSQSEKDDAHDAVDIYLHVRIVSRRSHRLLAGEQHSYHWPAVLDQPHGQIG